MMDGHQVRREFAYRYCRQNITVVVLFAYDEPLENSGNQLNISQVSNTGITRTQG